MKDSKINKNRSPFTEQEIANDKNFDKLLKQANGGGGSNGLIIGGVLGAIILTIGLVWLFNKSTPKENEIVETIELQKGAINPVLTDVPKSYYTVNALTGDEFKFNNTVISIPANAFVHQDGKEVVGAVEISYREFHNPVDFFLSGIPMVYDSAGAEYHFESAGMFEIYGYQNGEPVNLIKPIEVKLASLHQGDYFNLYKLDTLSGEWTYLSKDSTVVNKEEISGTEIADLNQKIAEIVQQLPPKKSEKGVCIKIDFNAAEFPELTTFKEVLFEVDENDKNFSPNLAKKDWDDVKLKKENENYVLTFYDRFKPTKIKAKPVLSDAEYAKALKEYNSNYGERLAAYKAKKDSVESLLAFKTRIIPSFGGSTSGYVERLFTINDFGVWNSDCPMRMPKGRMLAAMYINTNEETKEIDTLEFNTIYLVEENKNTLYRITNNGTLSYNPSKKYVLWAVDKQQRLCVYPAVKFNEIPSSIDSTYALEMDITASQPKNVDEVRKELNLVKLFKDV